MYVVNPYLVILYMLERRDRADKGGGGHLCYISDGLHYKRREDLESTVCEIIWIEIVYNHSKNILVGFTYRPPNCRAGWLELFDQKLDKVSHENKEILLLGDMNIDLLKTSGSVQNKLLHILEDASLTQVITTPTRVCSSSKSLIDHVYVSSPDSIVNSCVPHYAISDHYPVCITRKAIHHKKDVKIITYLNVKNLNVNLFMSDIFNAPWQTINQLSSPNVALVAWSNIFQGIIDKHLPIITKKVKHSNPASWMNEEIRYAMHTRDFLKRVNCHDTNTESGEIRLLN